HVTGSQNRYVLIGATGQLGFDLARTFDLPGTLLTPTHADLDVLDARAADEALRAFRPTHVLNTAAWNAVDAAERSRSARSRSTPRPSPAWPTHARSSAQRWCTFRPTTCSTAPSARPTPKPMRRTHWAPTAPRSWPASGSRASDASVPSWCACRGSLAWQRARA